ncbi:MAG TPA: glycogen debranching N-terminal domain-containing protein [Longimicrobiaceae bacterium]|nr:glycogen debranching N-terminal domain-containing protein [Longimicrobiaceae bacterium]
MNAADLKPISMEEAVGYPAIDCSHQNSVEDSLVLKHDRLFLLVNDEGDIVPPGQCALGLFQDDTRMLSHYQLEFAGGPPSVLSAQAARMYSAQIDLAISDKAFGGNSWDPKNSVHIRRELILEDRLLERVTLTSFVNTPIDFWMQLSVGCDFADIFEIRGWQRPERGQFYETRLDGDVLQFAYRGLDGKLIRSAVRFESEPPEMHQQRAVWRFRLEPNEPLQLRWEVLPDMLIDEADDAKATVYQRRGELESVYEDWRNECTQWISDVEQFNTALDQAVVDLRALYVTTDGGEIISAGIPWYSTAFGRDSIITSLQTLPVNPRIAVDTLRYLARYQGEKEDPFTEEQPGRIMHELRRGEMARNREIPHLPYYGTIDATPLWLVLLHEAWRWTGDDDLVRDLLPHAERALHWIDQYGDLDGDGFVEYARTSANGLVNQGWKDSSDGVPFPDGTLPEPPIALVEVQGYVFDAKRRMAAIYAAMGDPERADTLKHEADSLREAIVRDYWMEDVGTFALALDGDKKRIPTVTTNAGHLLWSRVPDREQARRMAGSFTDAGMFSGWGIRTLSSAHTVYNPMSYHDGSIWPHDNAIVALGLSLNGCTRAALPALSAMHDAAGGMRYHRLPELFCGMDRAFGLKPVLYPVSCSPQAWASGAFFMFLQAVTGILPDAPSRTLHIREPLLPQYMRELTLIGLKIGGSRVSLQFSRSGKRTLANLLEVEGEPLQVKIELC